MEIGLLENWQLLGGALLAQAEPSVSGLYIVQIISRILHILSAIILVGGIFYLKTVLAPAGSEACFAGRREVWARWVGIATFFLLASGIYNFMAILKEAKAAGDPLSPTYHVLFLIKFLLALSVMFLAAILAGKTAAAERFRSHMDRWLNIAWLAALAIVVLAAVMRSYH